MRHDYLGVAVLAMTLAACGDEANDDTNTPAAERVTFTNLRVEEITPTSAVVRFTTSLPTTCEVEYGLNAASLDNTALDPTMNDSNPFSVEHEVPLSGLSPETVYYLKAKAETPVGNVFRSAAANFSTLVEPISNMLNVALLSEGTTVTDVSSNFGGATNDATWGVNYALDGDMGTEWATQGDGDAAFLTLDLGQVRTLSELRFRSRRMSDGSSIITKVRLVWDSGSMTAGPFDAPDPLELFTFPLNPTVTTQTLRVEAVETTGGNTGAKEIQLMVEQ